MMRYYLQAPKGKPIQWPAEKTLDSYFAAIQEIFGLDREAAETILQQQMPLRTPEGVCFFKMDNQQAGRIN